MLSKCAYDCFQVDGKLEAYPDVSGPGVLIGFLGTAWFGVFLVVLQYFIAFDPSKDQFVAGSEQPNSSSESIYLPNLVDEVATWPSRKVKEALRRRGKSEGLLHKYLVERPAWQAGFERVLLSMADVQTVTGLGILLSGYSDLTCFISAYHWQVIVYLAWLSNTTHIACLSACRAYLFRHQLQRNIRLFFMFLLWVGLLGAMIPTAYFNWRPVEPSAAQPWSSARCFYDQAVAKALYNETFCVLNRWTGDEIPTDGTVPGSTCWTYSLGQSSAFSSAILSGLVLGLGSMFSVARLTRSTSEFGKVHVRRRVSGWTKRLLVAAMDKNAREGVESKRWRLAREVFIILPLTTVYLTGKLIADLLTSEIVGIVWLAVSAVWGTVQLQYTRNSVDVQEGEWGFGQLLSVFLLLGPVISAVEVVYTTPKTPVATPTPIIDDTPESDSDMPKSHMSSPSLPSSSRPKEPTSTPQPQAHPDPPPNLPISIIHILPLYHTPTSPTSPKTTTCPDPRPPPPPTSPPSASLAALQAHYSPSFLAATLTLAAAQILVPFLQSAQQLTAYWSVSFIFNIAVSTVFGVVVGNYFLFGAVWLATEAGYGRRALTGVGWCFRRGEGAEGAFALGRGVAMVVLGAGCTVVTCLSIVDSKRFWDVKGDFGYLAGVLGGYVVWGVGVVVWGR
ncbi:hypothetical protein QBC39DRAFT_415632 [Podospora conica]|nr:hypothetical protein QBC39DRAFT_415632 [Schizothecium conicum]